MDELESRIADLFQSKNLSAEKLKSAREHSERLLEELKYVHEVLRVNVSVFAVRSAE
ncbi:hypothetical protein HK096_011358 [Nowakowskiella sp. JEL0078]|nr:hypothetical protein HK096_011358 [Nowakowskiella sp. JEL0078]